MLLSLVGMKFPCLGKPLGAGQRQPLPAWLMAATVLGAKGEPNWDSPNSLLLPAILALWCIKPVAHHKSQEAKLVHLQFHSWCFVSALEEEHRSWKKLRGGEGTEKEERGDLGYLDAR